MIIADTETTGLTNEDKLVSLSMVKVNDNFEVIDERNQYFNPNREISPEATAIMGLTNKQLIGQPTFEEVAQKIIDYVGDETLVFHNSPFDMRFLNREFKACGIDINWKVIDSLELARNVFNSTHKRCKHNLDALVEYYDLTNLRKEYHSSLVDTLMLAKVYPLLLAEKEKAINDGRYWEFATLKKLLAKDYVVLRGVTTERKVFGGPCSTTYMSDEEVGEIWYGKITVFSIKDRKKITIWLNTLSVMGKKAYEQT